MKYIFSFSVLFFVSVSAQASLTNFVNFSEGKLKLANEKSFIFVYNSPAVIYSTLRGTIKYVGFLKPYGNVILIYHEDTLKTLYLGDITTSLNVNDVVTEGQIIGHAHSKQDRYSSIYFEVRHTDDNINVKITDPIFENYWQALSQL